VNLVDEPGNGAVTESRMYHLIRQPEPIAERQFEIDVTEIDLEQKTLQPLDNPFGPRLLPMS
jgi:hypothetical protein